MKAKLTKRYVEAVKPGPKDQFIWDTDLPMFGVKVTPKGARIYLAQYRIHGRLRRYTIGQHGKVTHEEARQEAAKLFGQVATGIDPAATRNALSKEMTVSELCDLYWKEGTGHKKESTLVSDKGRIAGHIKPVLGRMRVGDVEAADVQRFMLAVAKGQTKSNKETGKKRGRSIVRGGKGVANRSLILLSAIFNFAIMRGMRPDNPCRGVKKYPGETKERFLTAAELTKLGQALNDLEAAKANRTAIEAIRLIALTGARRNEILTLQWDFIDKDNQCLRLPESKENRGRAKVIPLGAPAMQRLSELPRLEGNPYVFPNGNGNGCYNNLSKFWQRVTAKAELPGVRIHDLRHTFASVGATSSVPFFALSALMGHRSTATTKRYAHLTDHPLKAAANGISGQIAASLFKQPGGEVIPINQQSKG